MLLNLCLASINITFSTLLMDPLTKQKVSYGKSHAIYIVGDLALLHYLKAFFPVNTLHLVKEYLHMS
jgi:hypothetical protein